MFSGGIKRNQWHEIGQRPATLLRREFQFLKSDSHLPKENFFICFNDSPSKIMKNIFYFILKALFVLKIFKLKATRQ